MINVNNWEERKQRYEDYWNNKNSTPIIYLTAPSDKQVSIELPPTDNYWFDIDYQIQSARAYFKNTYFAADSYPHVSPSFGSDIMSCFLGLDMIYNETSAWVVHKQQPLEMFRDFSLDRNNEFFIKMRDCLEKYVEDGRSGDYIVGMVDLNTLIDGISSLIGPDNLCYEILDNPEEVKRTISGHFGLFKQVYDIYNGIVTRYQKGNTNWLSVYSEIPWYFISIDFIVMLSAEHFDEFVLKPVTEMANFHERSMVHLDGENAVRHLERILTIKGLNGVQVQATPAAQCSELWIPQIKKIQRAGKTVWVEARNKQEIKDYITHLDPQGLFIKCWCDTQTEAMEIESMVKSYYGK